MVMDGIACVLRFCPVSDRSLAWRLQEAWVKAHQWYVRERTAEGATRTEVQFELGE